MAPKRSFAGAVVVITGAGGGMGIGFARRFARAGAQLGLLDADGEKLNALAAQLDAERVPYLALPCDVTDEQACGEAMRKVIDHFGGLDVLINNAGITHRSTFAETNTSVFGKVMAVNFFGSLYCAKAALPSLLQRRGLIIVVSSIAGIAPLYERTGYAASKHALHGLFESLRAELRGSGVEVLLVCPGFTATGIATAALEGDGSRTRHPQSTVGKVATPDSVADAVFRAAETHKRTLILTTVGKTTAVLNKLFPALYERLMTRSIRREIERHRS